VTRIPALHQRWRRTAANRILANEKVTSWNLKAFKYYYIPVPQLEALKSKWQQDVLDDVANKMPAIGEAVLREYDERAHGR
jgi:hypothetical protein